MILLKPYYTIITNIDGEEILKQIESAARTCYKSEGKIEYEDMIDSASQIICNNYYAKSARVLIPKLISRGHEAMLEFGGNITVKFVCDRGVSHELVRHRLASFSQESTRYCNYGNDENITFIIPTWIDASEGEYKDELDGTPRFAQDFGVNYTWYQSMLDSESAYFNLIQNGWSPQQARSVLPNSVKTEINVSANIREWRHILKLRTSKAAHPQMVELMVPLLNEFKERIPILFDDINN